MADYFSQSPNFVNPDYATPEQLANQRAYADALMKRSGEPANRPAGAIANMIDALTSGLQRNRANEIQQQAVGQNASDQAALIAQLQGGQKVDPDNLGRISANPMASPETRALVNHLLTMKPMEDVAGRPAYASPVTGVQASPIQGAFQPGFRAPESAGSVSTVTPFPAPMPSARPPVPSSPQVWGDREAEAAGLYPKPPAPRAGPGGGPTAPGPALPTGPAPAASVSSRIDALAAKDRELSATKEFTQGGAQAVNTVQKEDIAAATNAPTIKRVAGIMRDDLAKHGDKMTFGPTAEWSNTIKRAAANYAPGFMKDQLEALASADSFDKMSAQLTSMLAKGGGTDAQLFNNMKSVPGAHNSRQGAEALLKMVDQVADQQQALRQFTSGARNASEYESLRNDFFARNPITNPLTGNPIKLDLEKDRTQTDTGGFKVLKVH